MLSHLDENNNPKMVDISEKKQTERFAHARGVIHIPISIIKMFNNGDIQTAKGPVFITAKIAAVQAVKKTWELIPFCHQINLDKISVEIELLDDKIQVDCTAKCYGKTGVEMEVLTGVQVASLTIYDMCKAITQDMVLGEVYLVKKTGGKSDYERQ